MPSQTPTNPWSINYFNPPTPNIPAPAPKVKTPRLIPGVDDLFTVQRDALKALNALKDLERLLAAADLGKNERHISQAYTKAEREAENTYRVIRSFLEKYGQ